MSKIISKIIYFEILFKFTIRDDLVAERLLTLSSVYFKFVLRLCDAKGLPVAFDGDGRHRVFHRRQHYSKRA